VVTRRSIQIPGVAHGPGRPAGSRIGNLIYSANLTGRDPETRELADLPADQIGQLFQTMVRFLHAAGATVDDVLKVDITVTDPSYRDFVNDEWSKLFTDEESLPARKVTISPLNGSLIAELEVIAVTS
jgi:2-iminobutanoate/2-iminopropanoate deaminase